jgi:putative membrane protein
MIRLLATVACVAVVLASPARAQIGNPAGMAPLTPQAAPGVPAPDQLNQPDRLFIRQAAIGGMAEVELGKLAEEKGQDSAVKDFARRMVEDHAKANERLSALAKQAGITPPPQLDQEHRAMQEHLGGLSGAAYDRAYIQGQLRAHQKTAQLLEWEIGSGQDEQLKSFAAETLPVVLRHLRTAQGIAAELTGKTS